MRKYIKVLGLFILALTTGITTGCSATARAVGTEIAFGANPVVQLEQIRVMNNCFNTILLVAGYDGQEKSIPWGNAKDIFVAVVPDQNGGLPAITARAVGVEDPHPLVGTTWTQFRPRYMGGNRLHVWDVSALDHGERPCAVPQLTGDNGLATGSGKVAEI